MSYDDDVIISNNEMSSDVIISKISIRSEVERLLALIELPSGEQAALIAQHSTRLLDLV